MRLWLQTDEEKGSLFGTSSVFKHVHLLADGLNQFEGFAPLFLRHWDSILSLDNFKYPQPSSFVAYGLVLHLLSLYTFPDGLRRAGGYRTSGWGSE